MFKGWPSVSRYKSEPEIDARERQLTQAEREDLRQLVESPAWNFLMACIQEDFRSEVERLLGETDTSFTARRQGYCQGLRFAYEYPYKLLEHTRRSNEPTRG